MPHPSWKQDVFVSFVEDDPGDTFISKLFKRLHEVGIGYFGDDKRKGARENNEAKLLRAICHPTIAFALVVFSKTYVYSSPCLNELVEILYRPEDSKLVVIPIFYKDRAGVANLASNDTFKKALRSKKKTQTDAQEKCSALEKAGYVLKAAKGYVLDVEA